MGESSEQRREEADRLEGYVDVQLRFAAEIARRTDRPLSDAALQFTNLHRRLGLGRVEGGGANPAWAHYAARLDLCGSASERAAWTRSFFLDLPPEPRASRPFGCFSYELLDADRIVRIHFGNRDSDDGASPLAPAKADRRRSELAAMFRSIRERHPAARTVWGGSWLYNLEAYRRLFPPDYVASAFAPQRVRLDGTSSWGQLLDFRGEVKPAVRQALLAGLADLDVEAPWTAFPLRALAVRGPIESFWRFYELK
jgi:hypothetical protein